MSEPTWKSPSPANAAFFSAASDLSVSLVSSVLLVLFLPPASRSADAEEPLPVPPEVAPSPPSPLSPAFAETTPMTTTPTTAPSATLPFMPMAVSPSGRDDHRCSVVSSFAGSIRTEPVNRVNTIHNVPRVHGREGVDLAYIGMLGVTRVAQGWCGTTRGAGGCRTTRLR